MQKLAAYLIELHDGMNWPEARSSQAAQLKSHLEEWLRSKGVKEIAASGSYQAEDGSRATFSEVNFLEFMWSLLTNYFQKPKN